MNFEKNNFKDHSQSPGKVQDTNYSINTKSSESKTPLNKRINLNMSYDIKSYNNFNDSFSIENFKTNFKSLTNGKENLTVVPTSAFKYHKNEKAEFNDGACVNKIFKTFSYTFENFKNSKLQNNEKIKEDYIKRLNKIKKINFNKPNETLSSLNNFQGTINSNTSQVLDTDNSFISKNEKLLNSNIKIVKNFRELSASKRQSLVSKILPNSENSSPDNSSHKNFKRSSNILKKSLEKKPTFINTEPFSENDTITERIEPGDTIEANHQFLHKNKTGLEIENRININIANKNIKHDGNNILNLLKKVKL